MSGMAYVDVVFGSSSSLDAGRQAVLERVARASPRLPANVRLQVGPLASSTGWVLQYALVDPLRRESLLHWRHFQDDVLRPPLAAIQGVAEVASVGGEVQQIVVEAKPDQLRQKGLAYTDLLSRVRSALEKREATSLETLETLPLDAPSGQPLRMSDVARVRVTDDMPTGLADLGGGFQAVGGIVVARADANFASVVEEVKRTLDRERARLPAEVQLVTTYDRLDLIDRVGTTLIRALGEEVGVVVLVIVMFLLHGRSALVPLATLPLVLLMTFGAMWALGVPATIMSLGGIGIALGMAVDADVVALEACHRRLESAGAAALPEDRRESLLAAAGSFAPAILTSLVITALTFLPVFAFTGETGRLLRPLALTKSSSSAPQHSSLSRSDPP
jgi:Cu(I)/Ag(I) efflux system membrane protein CusA/SilA